MGSQVSWEGQNYGYAQVVQGEQNSGSVQVIWGDQNHWSGRETSGRQTLGGLGRGRQSAGWIWSGLGRGRKIPSHSGGCKLQS